MPTYMFRKKGTEEVFEKFMSLSAREQYLIDNPDIETTIGAPSVVRELTSKMKPDNGFRDLLKDIKKKNNKVFTPSTINTF